MATERPPAQAVSRDLRALCSGWGLPWGGPERVGRGLRDLLGAEPSDTLLDRVRRAVTDQLDLLPEELREVATTGLAIDRPATTRLTARLEALAEQRHYSLRTLDRNLNRALNLIASALVGGSDTEWHFRLFDATVRLDAGSPEALERRVVTVTKGSLSEIDTAISVPRHRTDDRPDHSIEVVVLHGGRLELREQPSESYFRHVIALSSPVRQGHDHEYLMMVRIPPGQPMSPHYVYIPHDNCDRFTLRIRFDPANVPSVLWRVENIATAVIYERRPGPNLLIPDSFGEVDTQFTNLQIGRGYGICWLDEPPLTAGA